MSHCRALEQRTERTWIDPFHSVESFGEPARTACLRDWENAVGPSRRVARRMTVAGCRLNVAAAEQLGDHRQGLIEREITGCKAVKRVLVGLPIKWD